MAMRIGVVAVSALLLTVAGLSAQDKSSKSGKLAEKAKLKPGEIPGYEKRTVEGFQLIINKDVLEQDTSEYKLKPMEAIEEELKGINRVVVPKLVKQLQAVTIWVEWDSDEVQTGGPGKVVAVYRGANIPRQTTGSIAMQKINQVEIVSTSTLTNLKQPGRSKQLILLHELVHAIHDKVLGFNRPDIIQAFQQANERKLYDSVEHRTGPKRRPYARTNDHEFFAEMSCAYLDRIDYFPYHRTELEKYDPATYKVLVQIWGKPEKLDAMLANRKYSLPPEKTTEKLPNNAEEAAALRLARAKKLEEAGRRESALEEITRLVMKHGQTQAAKDAKALAESILKP